MGKFFLIACIIASLMYGGQAKVLGHGEYDLEQLDENEIVAQMEHELKDFRLELERLNVTHEIPGVCQVCTWVLGKILPQVPNHMTKRILKSLLNKACRAYRVFGWVCRKFVNAYVNDIFNDIENKHMSSSRIICKAMHLCWWPAGPQKKHKQIL